MIESCIGVMRILKLILVSLNAAMGNDDIAPSEILIQLLLFLVSA